MISDIEVLKMSDSQIEEETKAIAIDEDVTLCRKKTKIDL